MQGRVAVWVQRKHAGRIPSCLGEASLYYGLQLIGWCHIMEDNLLCSKSTNLNVNLIQKNTFTDTSRMMFEQIFGHRGQPNWHIKLTITLRKLFNFSITLIKILCLFSFTNMFTSIFSQNLFLYFTLFMCSVCFL